MFSITHGYNGPQEALANHKVQSVAVLDLSNWRGSAPVFCGAPKGEEFGEGALSLKLGGGLDSELGGAKSPLAPL